MEKQKVKKWEYYGWRRLKNRKFDIEILHWCLGGKYQSTQVTWWTKSLNKSITRRFQTKELGNEFFIKKSLKLTELYIIKKHERNHETPDATTEIGQNQEIGTPIQAAVVP